MTRQRLMLVAALCAVAQSSLAENSAKDYCNKATELIAAGDTKAALEEARWCVDALEQQLRQAEQQVFAENLDGWLRGEIQQNQGMGVAVTEMRYSKQGKSIQVTLTGGDGPMAAFGAMAQLGMMQGGSRIRLNQHTGILSAQGELSVALKDGRLLLFKPQAANQEELIAFVKQFPLDQLDGG